MTPFIANPDAFGKDRRNEACLPIGSFLPDGWGEFQIGLEKLTETSVNVRMRRSQIHQSPKELVGTGSRSTDLEFVTHSNRTRCQFFTAFRLAGPENSGLVTFGTGQK